MCRKLSQTCGMVQLLAGSFRKAAAPRQMNWNPEQKLCGPKSFRVKIGWTFSFICLYIPGFFMKFRSVSISNPAKFFILTLCNDQHLLVLIALIKIWHGWILSWVLAHYKTQKYNEFSILEDPKALWSKLFMQQADGDDIYWLLNPTRFQPVIRQCKIIAAYQSQHQAIFPCRTGSSGSFAAFAVPALAALPFWRETALTETHQEEF